MTTYTWEFGAEGSGLHFTIVYNDATGEFTVTSLEGSFDLNALWWSDGDGTSDGYTLVKSDNSLNMNGSNTVWDDEGNETSEKIVWDDYQKLSSTGLGSEGEDKATFISEGESKTFDASDDFIAFLAGLDEGEELILGVRATSVNGDGSIKWVDKEPDVSEGEENQAPTDIRLNIDASFAAAVAGVAPPATADQPLNTTTGVAGEGGMLIGTLAAVDPDEGDTHTFEIVGVNPGDRFVIDGNELKLAEGKEIKEGDGSFQLTIKVTDSAGNEYYETFNFVADTSGNNNVSGTDKDVVQMDFGDGDVDVVIGDDIIFGFRGNDTLNDDGVALEGTSGDDALFGGRGNDDLYGGEGDDQLLGGAQQDNLYGGPGADIMSGGEGNDTFYWLAGDMEGTNDDHPDGLFDTITDWSAGNNTLDITDLLASFGFDSGNDDLADWVHVSNDSTDTVVAVATSEADALAGNYTNLVTLLGETFDGVGDLNIVA